MLSLPLAGDSNSISIGEGTAVQDKVLVHVGPSGPASEKLPAVIGSKVTIGESRARDLHLGACSAALAALFTPTVGSNAAPVLNPPLTPPPAAAHRPRCGPALVHCAR